MQALQPRVKEIQNRFKGKDQQEMQIEIAALYREAGVNPLAGCLPTLATLPVWIGLYRSAFHPSGFPSTVAGISVNLEHCSKEHHTGSG